MVWLWQDIAPVDRYTAACNGLLYEYDRKVLTLLYQPLIGPVSLSLYMTLWAQVEENRLWSDSGSHHELMDFMGLNLKTIYQARLKLEGIGLLKTFLQNKEDSRTFIYELQPPLSPAEFFQDGMLNVYLYRKIGKNHFLKLKKFFCDQSLQSLKEYRDVTKNFEDIYDSAVTSNMEYSSDLASDLGEFDNQDFIGRNESKGIQVDPMNFDFELLLAGLSESLVPKQVITKKVREAITNLSYLYGIDAIQMKNILISAMDDMNNEINIEEMRKAARDWYQLEHDDRLPLLVDKVQPLIFREAPKVPKTKEEKHIRYLETTSPREVLANLSGGGEASVTDLKVIEDVMFTQKLPPGVINVLIEYVLFKTNMKLTKGYVDKVASQWARLQLKTVKEAMDLAIKENQQHLEWAESKKTRKSTSGRAKPIRTELLPDWFDEPENSNSKDKTDRQENDFEEKKRKIEEKLKKYKKEVPEFGKD